MKKSIGWKKRMALGMSMTLALTGVTVAGSAVAAPRAEAVTKSNCYNIYSEWFWIPGHPKPVALILGTACYYDYNWWEETFLGKRDGWYRNT